MLRKAWLPVCLLLAACDDGLPKGQILATVAGDQITKRDFDAELATERGRGEPPSRSIVLDRLIDRAILVRLARREKLHLTPEYLAASRRADEDALIDFYRQFAGSELRAPDEAQVDAFIAAHSWMFAERQQLILDQIVATAPIPAGFNAAHFASLDALAHALSRSGVPYQRSVIALDSGGMADVEARLLSRVALNAPQIMGAGRFAAVSSRSAVPLKGDLARQVALAVMRRDGEERAAQALVQAEKARTRIRYRPDLSPARR